MPNPNQRQPGESYDYYITRRRELQQVEKLMDGGAIPRVLWWQRDTRTNKGVPYVRAVHGPLAGETARRVATKVVADMDRARAV